MLTARCHRVVTFGELAALEHKRARGRAGRGQPESELQVEVVTELQRRGLVFWHTQQAAQDGRQGARHKRAGVTAGVADIIVAGPGLAHPLALELKTQRGRQSPAQVAWQSSIERCGWYYYVARSVQDTIDILSAHGL